MLEENEHSTSTQTVKFPEENNLVNQLSHKIRLDNDIRSNAIHLHQLTCLVLISYCVRLKNQEAQLICNRDLHSSSY
ncbi:hypothetical protein CEXT_469601 [Caerostris extrusa]|uniref:Uncharacterized protein n=1 Tax=Caerostris extrusa TaxID=172846 RepID=A0AAV4W095_CAEEX|nr:hypothetical protein CEXT_469601 [Caerostris extrusa]